MSFRDMRVEQILAEAGVARSTFYQHFEDKAEVLRRLGHVAAEGLIEAFRGWARHPGPMSYDDLLEALLGIAVTYRASSSVFAAMAEASLSDAVVRDEFGQLFDVGKRELAAHLGAAQAAGLTRTHVDPVRTSAWLVWMVERGLYQQIRTARLREVHDEVAALAGIVWNAVYADSV